MSSQPPPSARFAEPGRVYLVGAGPGTIDLLTLRAHALLKSATCVLHDDLVSAEVLSLVSPECLVRNVGKRCGEKTVTQHQINEWMIGYAQSGYSVVRLKSGDPLLFGRAAEEMEALVRAEIPLEVVPGISTGFAAAAMAKIPLTGRITSSRVLFATRHLSAGATSGLAGIGPEATLVLYMPGRDYARIQAELMANGWPARTRCLAASSLGSVMQRIEPCTLDQLDRLPRLPSPVVMMFILPENV